MEIEGAIKNELTIQRYWQPDTGRRQIKQGTHHRKLKR